ncbi:helix-turn-helix domain-containing protein [Roseivirga echinicomitans]|uniref:Helix-turn-helix domain-containing protein n=1 Tax=Roseivirga echinicomitans TaxID=296218 RepID=A0A150XEQ6_9BACT|nr:helix-turn-helix domain-containing protein [Roseivirga echinicomitans]KYG77172.1 hypothetical protein AWN68_18235 [Roseivirga echinicomitans]
MRHLNSIIIAEIRKQVEDLVDQKLSKSQEPQHFLTREEAAEFCRTSLTNFDRWVAKGLIRAIKVHGRILFSRHWVIADLEEMVNKDGV